MSSPYFVFVPTTLVGRLLLADLLLTVRLDATFFGLAGRSGVPLPGTRGVVRAAPCLGVLALKFLTATLGLGRPCGGVLGRARLVGATPVGFLLGLPGTGRLGLARGVLLSGGLLGPAGLLGITPVGILPGGIPRAGGLGLPRGVLLFTGRLGFPHTQFVVLLSGTLRGGLCLLKVALLIFELLLLLLLSLLLVVVVRP